jgi:hypothetical protein
MVVAGVRIAVRHGTPASMMDGIDPAVVTEADLCRWLGDVEPRQPSGFIAFKKGLLV